MLKKILASFGLLVSILLFSSTAVIGGQGIKSGPVGPHTNMVYVFNYPFEVNFTGAFDNTACTNVREQQGLDGPLNCGTAMATQIIFPADSTLVEWRVSLFGDTGADWGETVGCALGLTADAGTSYVTGTNFLIPDVQGGSTDAGTVIIAPIGVEVAAGTVYELAISDGTNCDAGSGCTACTGGVDTYGGWIQLIVHEH